MKTEHSLDLTAHFALEGSQPFKDRRATMPWRGAIPVAKELLSQTWQEVISQPTPPRKRLVYLHMQHIVLSAVFIKTGLKKTTAPATPTRCCAK